MLLKLHPDNPSERKLQQAVQILEDGGVIIFPTDTVYALACAIDSRRAYERICRIRSIAPRKAQFSIIVRDMTQASPYLAQIDTPNFRILKRNLPGPFTFILEAGRDLPHYLRAHRKTIGLRVPDHQVTQHLVEGLGKPLITTSLRSDDEITEYFADPREIHAHFKHDVDCVIDSGPGTFEPSTVVDMAGNTLAILREGRGELAL